VADGHAQQRFGEIPRFAVWARFGIDLSGPHVCWIMFGAVDTTLAGMFAEFEVARRSAKPAPLEADGTLGLRRHPPAYGPRPHAEQG
jgi:hypothetical protein